MNEQGQLGVGDTVDRYKPTEIVQLSNLKIKEIFCGDTHCFSLTEIGNLYGWGCNAYGQLGIGHKIPQKQPTLISKDLKINQICSGFGFSILVTNSGILVSGRNENGQLGLGDKIDRIRFTKNKFLENKEILKIATKGHHSIALSSKKIFLMEI